MTHPRLTVTAEEKRERARRRTQRRLETMLRLIDKPGAERIFPDVQAVKARFRERLAIVRDPAAYREGNPGIRATGGQCRKLK